MIGRIFQRSKSRAVEDLAAQARAQDIADVKAVSQRRAIIEKLVKELQEQKQGQSV